MSRLMTVIVCLALASTGLEAANKEQRMTAHTIVTGTDIPVPAAGRRFVDALEKNAPRNASEKATN